MFNANYSCSNLNVTDPIQKDITGASKVLEKFVITLFTLHHMFTSNNISVLLPVMIQSYTNK